MTVRKNDLVIITPPHPDKAWSPNWVRSLAGVTGQVVQVLGKTGAKVVTYQAGFRVVNAGMIFLLTELTRVEDL